LPIVIIKPAIIIVEISIASIMHSIVSWYHS